MLANQIQIQFEYEGLWGLKKGCSRAAEAVILFSGFSSSIFSSRSRPYGEISGINWESDFLGHFGKLNLKSGKFGKLSQ